MGEDGEKDDTGHEIIIWKALFSPPPPFSSIKPFGTNFRVMIRNEVIRERFLFYVVN